ncbi:MAG: hypothetical protein CL534_01005 [Ahrensia sp.]|nr:hypothetical protein [Ahrensia sp.]
MKNSLRRVARGLAFSFFVAFAGHAAASPLASGNWLQVGNMSADIFGEASFGMFNGNCSLSSTCSYVPDSAGDFWNAFGTFAGQEILFVTGDKKIWARAAYSDVMAIVTARANVFAPNITWTDAGLGGVSIGSVTGNILSRLGMNTDPWITLRGEHCAHFSSTPPFPNANDCNLVIWGESNYGSEVHASLKDASGGVQVYVSAVPVPAALPLLAGGIGLLGLMARRGKRAVPA